MYMDKFEPFFVKGKKTPEEVDQCLQLNVLLEKALDLIFRVLDLAIKCLVQGFFLKVASDVMGFASDVASH